MDKIRKLRGHANVTVDLPPGQKVQVQRAAKASGMTVAKRVRKWIVHALDNNWTFEVRLVLREPDTSPSAPPQPAAQ